MMIYLGVYESILKCPAVPPETGGILGCRDGIISEFFFDSGMPVYDRASYIPDCEKLNGVILEWEKQGVQFCGIVHSHKNGQATLSQNDKNYIAAIMAAMPETVQRLYFPVVLPGVALYSYQAIRRSGNAIDIHEDSIQILEGKGGEKNAGTGEERSEDSLRWLLRT